MADGNEYKRKFQEALKLTRAERTSLEKLESVRVLVYGLNPKVDKLFDKCLEAFSKIEGFKKGEFLELSVELLPGETEEEKKRKKTIIFFIKTYKDLAAEIERIGGEFEKGDKNQNQNAVTSLSKILSGAKGPFGAVSLVALVIVAGLIFINSKKDNGDGQTQLVAVSPLPQSAPLTKLQVIIYKDKKIPLSELREATGPDCDSPHYHAKNQASVKALDGTTIADPGACAFGKTGEVRVLEVDSP